MSDDAVLVLFFGGLFALYVLIFIHRTYKEKNNELLKKLETANTLLLAKNQQIDNQKNDIDSLKLTINLAEREIISLKHKNNLMQQYIDEQRSEQEYFLSQQKEIFPYIAGMISDYLTLEHERAAKFLLTKKRPALKEAQRIDELRINTKNMLTEYKMYEYQLKYLLELYPELDDVLDAEFSDIATIDYTEHDPVRDWLSTEEWRSLPEVKKNQMALDRYIAKRKKSNWQIGRDYELYIGQYYEKLGYSVEYYGMDKKLEDLGRDLIAKKDNKTLIIQCKCWSKHKQIHENSITQLFGTVTAYRVEYDESLFNIIEGVLVTTIELSETAKKFAKILNISVVENIPMQEFPRIKCNIGKNGEKIYHLPMDQQYDKVKIDKPGECYAYTVDEAEQKGFRRAFRYNRIE